MREWRSLAFEVGVGKNVVTFNIEGAVVHLGVCTYQRNIHALSGRLGIVATLSLRQFWNEDNNCRNKMMETIKTIKILGIMLLEKHN